MKWLFELHQTQPVAYVIGAIALVCVIGMALGSVKVRGVRLGTAGVLFSGILFGHFGKPVDHETLDFVKEFGLILFVFTIGLQLGPGFGSALRQQGVKMNVLAAAIVVMGAVIAPLSGKIAGFDPAAVLGIFSGASTNTPSLGAATQTLSLQPGLSSEQLALPALAYAVTYPAAIVGIIGTLMFLKWIFRIDPAAEAKAFASRQQPHVEPLERRTLVVTNPNLDGLTLAGLPGRVETNVTITRMRHAGEEEIQIAHQNVEVKMGDMLTVVGTKGGLEQFERVVGDSSVEDLVETEGPVTFRRVVLTNRDLLGKTVEELDAPYGVIISRITRADIEMTAVQGLHLQFGDMLHLVGSEENLRKAAELMGDSLKELTVTHFIPLFLGIVLGVMLGTLPITIPGMPQPVRLGLAGGPLIVALLLGRFGRIGKLVFRMPESSNLAFREFGIALFFAAVGLVAGERFFEIVFSTRGLNWLFSGLVVTLVPLLAIGILARVVWKMNFMDLSGLISGSMTDPPALAFATNISGSDAPTVGYATVYPLTTLLRIFAAQILAIALFG